MRLSQALAAVLDALGERSKPELVELCKQQDVSTKGSRDELIYRLVNQPRIELGNDGKLHAQ